MGELYKNTLNKKMMKHLKMILGIALFVICPPAVFFYTVNKRTNKLRLNLKTGDRVRFYILNESHTGKVEKVYYVKGKKAANISWNGHAYPRLGTEIYLPLL